MESFYNDDLRDLVYDFFLRFSRFEFALKETDYVRASRFYDTAEVDWEKFLARYQDNYSVDELERELLNNPPKRQVFKNHQISWEDFRFNTNDSNLKKLTLAIRTMRNNLFHGGKFGERSWDNPERVTFVLSRGIHSLNKMTTLNVDLNAHYNGTY